MFLATDLSPRGGSPPEAAAGTPGRFFGNLRAPPAYYLIALTG